MRRLLPLFVAVLSLHPLPAEGQSDLDRVDRLVEDGRVLEARGRLLDWWDDAWDDASRNDRERALWMRGRLTLEPSEASAIYRRLVVEYPVGAFADQVLGRLAALAALEGDTLTAQRWYAVLQRDHPTSRTTAEGERWLDANRAAIDRARDQAASRPSQAPPRPAAPVAPRGDWTVQLGAFAARGRADGYADELRDEGFVVRVVQVAGSELWRVRSGRFPDDGDARDLYDRIRAAGFDAAIVPGASTERGR